MNKEKTEKKRAFIIDVLYLVVVMAIVVFLFRYVVPFLMPFIVGFVIAYLLKPIINFLSRKTRINRRVVACFIVLLAYALVVLLLWLLGSKIYYTVVQMGEDDYFNRVFQETILPTVNSITQFVTKTIENFSPNAVEQIYGMSSQILDWLYSLVTSLGSWAGNLVKDALTGLPGLLTTLMFAIMSSVFLTMDYKTVSSFIVKQFPPKYREYIFDFKKYLTNTAFRYFRAILVLMLITFTELCIGLLILRVDNAIGLAALIALGDALPVLGTGGMMIPWMFVEVIKGNYSLAIGLAVVYAIITLIRNFLEPKVVGQSLGLHPIVSLLSIYLGLKFMGIFGMIIMPIVAIIIINFQESGKVTFWK